jgi:hypothetical protein
MLLRWLGLSMLTLMCGACAGYNFMIKEPPTPQPLVTAQAQTLAIAPLSYRLLADEGKLVMFIENPTPNTIDLLGGQCVIADPNGNEHPLHDLTIPPHSSAELIFPPDSDEEADQTVSDDFLAPHPIGPAGNGGIIVPQGYRAVPATDDADRVYRWNWDGESDVSMTLVYQEHGKGFEHRLVFHRVKK